MTAEWVGIAVLLLSNMAALIWGASRLSGTVDRLDRTQEKLAETLDKLTELVSTEQQTNAVQNARLHHIEDRVKRLEER